MKKLILLLAFLPVICFGEIIPYNFDQTITLKYTDKFCAGEILNTNSKESKIDIPMPFTCTVRVGPPHCSLQGNSFWYSYKRNGNSFWSVRAEDNDLQTEGLIKRMIWTKKDKSMSICMVNANPPSDSYTACVFKVNCHYTTYIPSPLYIQSLKISPSKALIPIIPIP